MEDAFFEKAKTWDMRPLGIKMAEMFASELQKNISLQKNLELLEFGCGTGQVGMRLYDHVKSILMIDTSPAMLAVLRDKITTHNVKIMEGDIVTLDIEESSIDIVFSLMAFHHVANIPAVLRKFHSVLKPEGQVVIGDLVREDGSFHQGEQVAHNGFDLDDITKLFTSNGYTVQKLYPYHVIERPDVNSVLRQYEQFILIAQKQ